MSASPAGLPVIEARKITLVGWTLAKVRGNFAKVRFRVSAPGHITVTKLLTVPGGVVTD